MGKLGLFISRMAMIATMVGFFAGCATQEQAKRRYFWPNLPDTPRVEWLGAYQGQQDLAAPSAFESFIGADEGAGLDKPLYIASDAAGKVYVGDVFQTAVFVFDFNKKHVNMLGGEKALGLLEHPTGIDLDADGNIYVADNKKRKVFVFDKDERVLAALDLSKEMKSIGGLAVDKVRKRIIVADTQGHQVGIYSITGKLIHNFGKRGTGDGEFNFPLAVALDKEGNIVVCDAFNARIERFNPEGAFIGKFGERGDSPGNFSFIKGVAVDSEGHIYVTDGKANTVGIFSNKGEFLLSFGAPFALEPGTKITPGGFLVPQGIYIDKNDGVFVVDQLNRRFQVMQYLNPRYLAEHPIPEYKPPVDAGAGAVK